jgi:segregation and condensation protein A
MDPWDINVTLLSQRFLEMVNKLKKMDFRISGKIILAAAILLKIKSNRLLTHDISNLDKLFAQSDEEEEGLLDELVDEYKQEREILKDAKLIPKTPQPRKRKVSIYDLVGALQKAIEVKKRRVMQNIPPMDMEIPEKKVDITTVIKGVYGKIKGYFASGESEKLTFTKLVPSGNKLDKVYTFIPLLHLTNQRKIDLLQEQHFGEIEVHLLRKAASQEVSKELNVSS